MMGALALASALAPATAIAGGGHVTPPATYTHGRRSVMPAATREAFDRSRAATAATVPSFSRQTGLACSACHYQFPSLTPFGRQFKLNGYTLTGLKMITETEPKKKAGLSLSPIPAISFMAQASFTELQRREPGTQNGVAAFPDQLSIFLAGAWTPHIGSLVQVTYTGQSGTFGIDNSDIRYANRTEALGGVIYGFTLNNNPSVQDLWNTTPAWGFPYALSGSAPQGAAATLIDGGLGQQVVGLGAYAMWNDWIYLEGTAYRTAIQGHNTPLDSSATGVIPTVAPYWRLAIQHSFGVNYVEVGTYGLAADQYLNGVSGLVDRFLDYAADAQLEHPLGTNGGAIILRTTWIHETSSLRALAADSIQGAAQPDHNLETFRLNVSAMPNALLGATLGYFQTVGTRDSLLYAPSAVSGSQNGRPETSGVIGEIDFNPWQNTRLGVQYTYYGTFNGGYRGYDGFGRKSTDNNTLYLLAWLAF
jgi:hypothetical protein